MPCSPLPFLMYVCVKERGISTVFREGFEEETNQKKRKKWKNSVLCSPFQLLLKTVFFNHSIHVSTCLNISMYPTFKDRH